MEYHVPAYTRDIKLAMAAGYQKSAHEAWLIYGNSEDARWLYAKARDFLFSALEMPS